jgi:thymidylate synthase ThyX
MAKIVSPGKARVSIVSYTNEPVRAIALAQLNMRGDMRHRLADISMGEAQEIFLDICKTELAGAFEFAHFNIQLDGVSRAFQQQLTRTRLASYSAESLRFTDKRGMEVLAGPGLCMEDEVDWRVEYQLQCDHIERLYMDMVDAGIPTEDARGILPLNVLSKIGMSVSYKTIIGMSRVRMCYQSQPGEWGDVFNKIVIGLKHIDPLLTKPLGAFCTAGQDCPFGSRLDRDCPRRK